MLCVQLSIDIYTRHRGCTRAVIHKVRKPADHIHVFPVPHIVIKRHTNTQTHRKCTMRAFSIHRRSHSQADAYDGNDTDIVGNIHRNLLMQSIPVTI